MSIIWVSFSAWGYASLCRWTCKCESGFLSGACDEVLVGQLVEPLVEQVFPLDREAKRIHRRASQQGHGIRKEMSDGFQLHQC